MILSPVERTKKKKRTNIDKVKLWKLFDEEVNDKKNKDAEKKALEC